MATVTILRDRVVVATFTIPLLAAAVAGGGRSTLFWWETGYDSAGGLAIAQGGTVTRR